MNIWSKGLRTIAIVVAAKGLAGIVAGSLLLLAGDQDMHDHVSSLLEIIHADSYGRIARWLQGAAERMNAHRTEVIFIGFAYGGFKLIESVGLWFEKRWAEWLVVLSTVLCFMPIEIYELCRKVTLFKLAALGLNIAIVAFMAMLLKTKPASQPSVESGCDAGR
jgi:uncharacterized membrane protein (DUF2068 family)